MDRALNRLSDSNKNFDTRSGLTTRKEWQTGVKKFFFALQGYDPALLCEHSGPLGLLGRYFISTYMGCTVLCRQTSQITKTRAIMALGGLRTFF